MARRIGKHATRLAQQYQGALDPAFTAGQRVQTIDGLPGRILFAAASFAPGLTEYEVMLDHGMGQGTYTATQLRPLPADYRAGPAGSNLPAGVTAAMEAEAAELHTADLDYPEMGSVLQDRPDPGAKIEVIGHRVAAGDSYGGPEDPRDEDYEGGENDTGVHWAGPAQQNWMHENEPPQEEAPPPEPVMAEEEMPPALARLAQIEEACQLVGTRHSGTLVFGTVINGTEIDGHGDAPEHGTTPRASDPEDYDSRSDEGDEDPKWDEGLHPGDEKKYKPASSGMYPTGVSSDGGISVGASRVPWTGQERGNLHNWDNGAAATWGDFVNSREFTNRHPVTEQVEDQDAPDVIEQELSRERSARTAAVSQPEWAAHLVAQHGYDGSAVARSAGQGNLPGDLHAAIHDAGLADHIHPAPDAPRAGPDLARQRHAAQAVPGDEHDAPAFDEADPDDPGQQPGGDQLEPGGPGAEPPSDDPDDWPVAGAGVTSGGEAYTQGQDDGQRPWGGHKNRSRDALAPTVPAMMQQLDQAQHKVQDQQVQLDKLNQASEPGKDGEGEGPDEHLAALIASAGSAAFRFEFTAAWRDVLAKAKRIRKAGKVRLTHVGAGMVIGEVAGDHDVYEAGIQRPPGKPQTIQHWACGCPWATFNQDSSLGTRYAGRPCSHVMAVQLEAQARSMFGREIDTDPTLRELGHDPYPVVVRSVPPWTDNGWAQHWLAPAASLQRTAEMFCPACGDDRDDSGRCYGCGMVSRDLRQEKPLQAGGTATFAGPDPEPGEEGYEEQSEEQAEREQDHNDGCYYEHEGPCLPFDGMTRTAESIRHSRPRGYSSEIDVNMFRDPQAHYEPMKATHVLRGRINGEHVGSLHFSVSDDGKAHRVDMLSSGKPNSGLGSAMMDDLYSHVKAKGGWLDHGVRTDQGNSWWAGYREPHPEVSTHHAPAGEGWHKYFNPDEVAADAAANHSNSGGRGAHTPLNYSPGNYQNRSDPDRDAEWAHARGVTPSQRAVAALRAAGEDLAELSALAALAGFTVRADQANGSWGDDNVSQHPPVKPYGATEKPDLDQDPGSYGFLSAPDPANWGEIQENNLYETSPMNSEAALDPSDPESMDLEAELHDKPEPALPATTAEPEPSPTAMGNASANEGLTDVAQEPSPVTQEPGMGSMDEEMSPDDPSIQTIGGAQAEDEIVAAFQRSAAARQFTGSGEGGSGTHSAGDIAAAAKEYLAKTAEALPEAEAAALIAEGRGERARNLGLLKLEGTHYEDQDEELGGRGLSLDDFDDDVVSA